MGAQVSKIDPSMPEEDAKAHLADKISGFVQARVAPQTSSNILELLRRGLSPVEATEQVPSWVSVQDWLRRHHRPCVAGCHAQVHAAACWVWRHALQANGQCTYYRHTKKNTGWWSQVAFACMQEKILIADQQLVATAAAKIVTGDVILTFAASSVVLEVLLQTHAVRTCGRVSPI